MNKISFLFIVGVLALAVVGGSVFYLQLSKSSFDNDVVQADSDLSKLTRQAEEYRAANVEKAVSAKKTLDIVKQGYIKWSEVIEKILATTPKNPDTKAPLVEYSSYSGAEGSKLNISAKTLEDRDDPFSDVANLIRAFSGSTYFKGPFVPSISTNVLDNGKMVLSFNFYVDFVQADKTENK